MTEAAAVRAFDGNELKAELPVVDVTKPVKRARKSRKSEGENPKPKAVKPSAKPGYHDLFKWLESPEGGDTKIPGEQFGRVGKSVNAIIEIGLGHGWLVWEEGQDVADVATDDLLFYVSECWNWVKREHPYKGKLDIHNVAARLNEWWNVEGKTKFAVTEQAYIPMGPTW